MFEYCGSLFSDCLNPADLDRQCVSPSTWPIFWGTLAREALIYGSFIAHAFRFCREKLPIFEKSMQIAGYDDELWAAIKAEEVRQEEHIELISFANCL